MRMQRLHGDMASLINHGMLLIFAIAENLAAGFENCKRSGIWRGQR